MVLEYSGMPLCARIRPPTEISDQYSNNRVSRSSGFKAKEDHCLLWTPGPPLAGSSRQAWQKKLGASSHYILYHSHPSEINVLGVVRIRPMHVDTLSSASTKTTLAKSRVTVWTDTISPGVPDAASLPSVPSPNPETPQFFKASASTS